MVLLNDFFGASVQEEINFNLTSNGNVTKGGSAVIIKLDNRVLSIGIFEVKTEEISFVFSLN